MIGAADTCYFPTLVMSRFAGCQPISSINGTRWSCPETGYLAEKPCLGPWDGIVKQDVKEFGRVSG